MRLSALRIDAIWRLTWMLVVITPVVALAQAEKPLPKKYLKDMATLYESLAITDVQLKDPQPTNTMFRPYFKITNLTDRALEVPLRPGLNPDKACILGLATCKLRRIGDKIPKNEATHVFFSPAKDICLLIAPKATVSVEIPTHYSLKSRDLQTGDYEVTLEYGLHNQRSGPTDGPKVKSVVKRIRIENTEAGMTAKQRVVQTKSENDGYAQYCRAIFDAVKPYEVSLSVDKIKAGAPLEVSFVLSKVEGQSLPDPYVPGKQPHTLTFSFSLHKIGGAKSQPPVWRDGLLLSPYALAPLKKEGALRKTFHIATHDFPPGNYDFVVEVSRGGEPENAPRPQKLRLEIVR